MSSEAHGLGEQAGFEGDPDWMNPYSEYGPKKSFIAWYAGWCCGLKKLHDDKDLEDE